MHKLRILQRIMDRGVVAVIRAGTGDLAMRIVDACLEGGIDAIELTFTVPGAFPVIECLTRKFSNGEALIGAGTVLDPETARTAILSGAAFVVSPYHNSGTGQLCRRYQKPYIPGAGTVAETMHALEDGADVIKLFPGESLGPGFVKAMRAPLPDIPVMPSGGVSVENAGDWIRAGCVAVSVGGTLTRGADTGDFDSISQIARKLVEKVRQARVG